MDGLGYYAGAATCTSARSSSPVNTTASSPLAVAALTQLPGIGPSTAGAIAAISQGQHAAILDGNVKRVLARFHAVDGYPGDTTVSKRLWHFAHYHTPRLAPPITPKRSWIWAPPSAEPGNPIVSAARYKRGAKRTHSARSASSLARKRAKPNGKVGSGLAADRRARCLPA